MQEKWNKNNTSDQGLRLLNEYSGIEGFINDIARLLQFDYRNTGREKSLLCSRHHNYIEEEQIPKAITAISSDIISYFTNLRDKVYYDNSISDYIKTIKFITNNPYEISNILKNNPETSYSIKQAIDKINFDEQVVEIGIQTARIAGLISLLVLPVGGVISLAGAPYIAALTKGIGSSLGILSSIAEISYLDYLTIKKQSSVMRINISIDYIKYLLNDNISQDKLNFIDTYLGIEQEQNISKAFLALEIFGAIADSTAIYSYFRAANRIKKLAKTLKIEKYENIITALDKAQDPSKASANLYNALARFNTKQREIILNELAKLDIDKLIKFINANDGLSSNKFTKEFRVWTKVKFIDNIDNVDINFIKQELEKLDVKEAKSYFNSLSKEDKIELNSFKELTDQDYKWLYYIHNSEDNNLSHSEIIKIKLSIFDLYRRNVLVNFENKNIRTWRKTLFDRNILGGNKKLIIERIKTVKDYIAKLKEIINNQDQIVTPLEQARLKKAKKRLEILKEYYIEFLDKNINKPISNKTVYNKLNITEEEASSIATALITYNNDKTLSKLYLNLEETVNTIIIFKKTDKGQEKINDMFNYIEKYLNTEHDQFIRKRAEIQKIILQSLLDFDETKNSDFTDFVNQNLKSNSFNFNKEFIEDEIYLVFQKINSSDFEFKKTRHTNSFIINDIDFIKSINDEKLLSILKKLKIKSQVSQEESDLLYNSYAIFNNKKVRINNPIDKYKHMLFDDAFLHRLTKEEQEIILDIRKRFHRPDNNQDLLVPGKSTNTVSEGKDPLTINKDLEKLADLYNKYTEQFNILENILKQILDNHKATFQKILKEAKELGFTFEEIELLKKLQNNQILNISADNYYLYYYIYRNILIFDEYKKIVPLRLSNELIENKNKIISYLYKNGFINKTQITLFEDVISNSKTKTFAIGNQNLLDNTSKVIITDYEHSKVFIYNLYKNKFEEINTSEIISFNKSKEETSRIFRTKLKSKEELINELEKIKTKYLLNLFLGKNDESSKLVDDNSLKAYNLLKETMYKLSSLFFSKTSKNNLDLSDSYLSKAKLLSEETVNTSIDKIIDLLKNDKIEIKIISYLINTDQIIRFSVLINKISKSKKYFLNSFIIKFTEVFNLLNDNKELYKINQTVSNLQIKTNLIGKSSIDDLEFSPIAYLSSLIENLKKLKLEKTSNENIFEILDNLEINLHKFLKTKNDDLFYKELLAQNLDSNEIALIRFRIKEEVINTIDFIKNLIANKLINEDMIKHLVENKKELGLYAFFSFIYHTFANKNESTFNLFTLLKELFLKDTNKFDDFIDFILQEKINLINNKELDKFNNLIKKIFNQLDDYNKISDTKTASRLDTSLEIDRLTNHRIFNFVLFDDILKFKEILKKLFVNDINLGHDFLNTLLNLKVKDDEMHAIINILHNSLVKNEDITNINKTIHDIVLLENNNKYFELINNINYKLRIEKKIKFDFKFILNKLDQISTNNSIVINDAITSNKTIKNNLTLAINKLDIETQKILLNFLSFKNIDRISSEMIFYTLYKNYEDFLVAITNCISNYKNDKNLDLLILINHYLNNNFKKYISEEVFIVLINSKPNLSLEDLLKYFDKIYLTFEYFDTNYYKFINTANLLKTRNNNILNEELLNYLYNFIVSSRNHDLVKFEIYLKANFQDDFKSKNYTIINKILKKSSIFSQVKRQDESIAEIIAFAKNTLKLDNEIINKLNTILEKHLLDQVSLSIFLNKISNINMNDYPKYKLKLENLVNYYSNESLIILVDKIKTKLYKENFKKKNIAQQIEEDLANFDNIFNLKNRIKDKRIQLNYTEENLNKFNHSMDLLPTNIRDSIIKFFESKLFFEEIKPSILKFIYAGEEFTIKHLSNRFIYEISILSTDYNRFINLIYNYLLKDYRIALDKVSFTHFLYINKNSDLNSIYEDLDNLLLAKELISNFFNNNLNLKYKEIISIFKVSYNKDLINLLIKISKDNNDLNKQKQFKILNDYLKLYNYNNFLAHQFNQQLSKVLQSEGDIFKILEAKIKEYENNISNIASKPIVKPITLEHKLIALNFLDGKIIEKFFIKNLNFLNQIIESELDPFLKKSLIELIYKTSNNSDKASILKNYEDILNKIFNNDLNLFNKFITKNSNNLSLDFLNEFIEIKILEEKLRLIKLSDNDIESIISYFKINSLSFNFIKKIISLDIDVSLKNSIIFKILKHINSLELSKAIEHINIILELTNNNFKYLDNLLDFNIKFFKNISIEKLNQEIIFLKSLENILDFINNFIIKIKNTSSINNNDLIYIIFKSFKKDNNFIFNIGLNNYSFKFEEQNSFIISINKFLNNEDQNSLLNFLNFLKYKFKGAEKIFINEDLINKELKFLDNTNLSNSIYSFKTRPDIEGIYHAIDKLLFSYHSEFSLLNNIIFKKFLKSLIYEEYNNTFRLLSEKDDIISTIKNYDNIFNEIKTLNVSDDQKKVLLNIKLGLYFEEININNIYKNSDLDLNFIINVFNYLSLSEISKSNLDNLLKTALKEKIISSTNRAFENYIDNIISDWSITSFDDFILLKIELESFNKLIIDINNLDFKDLAPNDLYKIINDLLSNKPVNLDRKNLIISYENITAIKKHISKYNNSLYPIINQTYLDNIINSIYKNLNNYEISLDDLNIIINRLLFDKTINAKVDFFKYIDELFSEGFNFTFLKYLNEIHPDIFKDITLPRYYISSDYTTNLMFTPIQLVVSNNGLLNFEKRLLRSLEANNKVLHEIFKPEILSGGDPMSSAYYFKYKLKKLRPNDSNYIISHMNVNHPSVSNNVRFIYAFKLNNSDEVSEIYVLNIFMHGTGKLNKDNYPKAYMEKLATLLDELINSAN